MNHTSIGIGVGFGNVVSIVVGCGVLLSDIKPLTKPKYVTLPIPIPKTGNELSNLFKGLR
jgi:hypothetical protein